VDDRRPLRRVSVTVPLARAEEARATMLELFPEGFEEVEDASDVELVAYTDASGEERLWHTFGGARTADVEAGWEERWRSFHRPVVVGPVWVGPPWVEPPSDRAAVVIDPGRAFGTGAHATTRLCLELLLEGPRGALLDLGCGSGVLAIAAAVVGFTPVIAVDVDPVAIEATRENAAVNGVEVKAVLADAETETLPATETAVVNITHAAAAHVASRLRCERLVTSGYLVSDSLEPPGFRHVRRLDADGWAADLWEGRSE
jgi:ribosomal protein L11 methyltransferase